MRLGYDKSEMTTHGFRATATTLLNEMGTWHPDAIEPNLLTLKAMMCAALTRGRALGRARAYDEGLVEVPGDAAKTRQVR